MDLRAFQQTIADTYLERDRRRGTDATFLHLTEEIGELARALRTGDRENLVHELGDVQAWLASVANLVEVPLSDAADRFSAGCPACGSIPCRCPFP